MDATISVDIRNRFLITVDDIKTGEHREYKAENIILNAMYNRLCEFLSYFDYIHFGTGTGDFDDATRTKLYTFLGSKQAVLEFKDEGYPTSQLRKKIVLNPEEHVGKTITEIGIAYGSAESYLMTHAGVKDSEGGAITIGPKKATEIVTIYSDVFATLYSPDYGLYFAGNGLRNYLLGGNISSEQIGIALNGNDWTDDKYNYDAKIKTSARTPDATNKKVTSYARFQSEDYNKDIRFIYWNSIGTLVELPRPGVWSPMPRAGVTLGIGDGAETVFPIINQNVTVNSVYIDGVKQPTGWTYNSVGAIEFTTAPGNGLSVTADYVCPYVPKDSDHVFDVTWTLQYGAGAPPAVVAPPDQSGYPGPTTPTGGTTTLGFFGEVPAANLINGEDLCEMIGLTEGTLINSAEPWLKFARNSKIMYIAKKTIRYDVSWDDIHAAGAAFGRMVTIGGKKYTVRLLTSQEWNDLIYPVHVDYGQWAQYTNADLLVASGNGCATWTTTPSGSTRVDRGYSSVSSSGIGNPSYSNANYGFRPCLVPILLPATL